MASCRRDYGNYVPIYFGHEDVKKEFNTKSFINFNDFKDIDEFIKHIIEVDKNDKLYRNYLNESWYIHDKFPKDMYYKRILKRFKEIFG